MQKGKEKKSENIKQISEPDLNMTRCWNYQTENLG